MQQSGKNILVIFSSVKGDNSQEILNDYEATLRARVPGPITIYDEYLVWKLDSEGRGPYLESVSETLRRTYAAVKLNLVIAISPEAIQLAEQYRDKIFPGVPILFTEVAPQEPTAQPGPGITGLTTPIALGETIDLAVRLHPDTQTVAVVADPRPEWLAATHSELQRYRNRIREIDFVEPASRNLFAKVAALPAHTIVLFMLGNDLSTRSDFGGLDLLRALAKRWPTYTPWMTLCLRHGCVGGVFGTRDQHAAIKTARIAARILLGERPEDIPVEHSNKLEVIVDWRELQYWHIPESALPAGTTVVNRGTTFWGRDRKYIISAIALIVAQALLIAALLWQRYRKRKAEAVLRESEERFRVMADSTPSLIWMCDKQGKITYLNEQFLAFTGPETYAGYGDTWIAFVHRDDVKKVLDELWQALKNQKPFSRGYRLHRSDGVYRWMFDVASPRVNGDGTFVGFIGSVIDVTDQKLAQQALTQISGRLIEAQEKERTRIARDLHDDICQRLALLSMELEQAERDSKGGVSATKNLEEIRKHCCEIAGDVQSLSHQLHSSKLDLLGIAAAIQGFCREIGKQHNVTVDFTNSNVPRQMPKDISLCLFRVAQESLHNAIKYSGTDQFKVHLSATAEEVYLQVTDGGAGFDVEETKRNRGLGLVSMRERVDLVHGRLAVESKPGTGTKVIAVVPLADENGHIPENETAKETASLRETS